MLLCFKLSMPGISSWNGKWSGSDDFYAVVKNIGSTKKAKEKGKEILKTGYYTYSFGDGWRAGIDVTEVNSKDTRKIRAKSKGFCGYDWMVDSILMDGKIVAPSDRKS